MKPKANEVIHRDKLERSKGAEQYAKKLEELFVDIKTTPHFSDEEVHLEDWSVSWFLKETKDEIEWTVVIALMMFINQTGQEVSYCLTDSDFKKYATAQEQFCLGKGVMVVNQLDKLDGFQVITE